MQCTLVRELYSRAVLVVTFKFASQKLTLLLMLCNLKVDNQYGCTSGCPPENIPISLQVKPSWLLLQHPTWYSMANIELWMNVAVFLPCESSLRDIDTSQSLWMQPSKSVKLHSFLKLFFSGFLYGQISRHGKLWIIQMD